MASVFVNGADFRRVFEEEVLPGFVEMVFRVDGQERDDIVRRLGEMPPEFWMDVVKDAWEAEGDNDGSK